jgi:hypothetical protein
MPASNLTEYLYSRRSGPRHLTVPSRSQSACFLDPPASCLTLLIEDFECNGDIKTICSESLESLGQSKRRRMLVSTLWLRIWLAVSHSCRVDCSCATIEPLSCGILFAGSLWPHSSTSTFFAIVGKTGYFVGKKKARLGFWNACGARTIHHGSKCPQSPRTRECLRPGL